jgi:hypothetical protein
VDLGFGGPGGVEGGAGVSMQEQVSGGRFSALSWGRLRHGGSSCRPQQSGTTLPVPEQIGTGRSRVFLFPVMAMMQ